MDFDFGDNIFDVVVDDVFGDVYYTEIASDDPFMVNAEQGSDLYNELVSDD